VGLEGTEEAKENKVVVRRPQEARGYATMARKAIDKNEGVNKRKCLGSGRRGEKEIVTGKEIKSRRDRVSMRGRASERQMDTSQSGGHEQQRKKTLQREGAGASDT